MKKKTSHSTYCLGYCSEIIYNFGNSLGWIIKGKFFIVVEERTL
jgi:hypothetical protein